MENMREEQNVIVRQATLEDAECINLLNLDSLGYDFPLASTVAALEKVLSQFWNKVYVAEIGDLIVGYIHACDYELLYSDSMKNVLGLAVHIEYQGFGVGSKLLEAVENWAAESGCSGVRLNSDARRVEAHAFYESRGYVLGPEKRLFYKYFD